MRFVRPALLPILFMATCSAADQLQQTLARMDAAAASFKAMTADLQRVNYTFVIKEEDRSSGTIVVRRAKPKEMQVLVDIKEPDPRQISFSGRTGQLYNPKTNTVQIAENMDKKYGGVVNEYLLLGFGSDSKDLQEVYTIALGGPETVAGQSATKIELTPRNPDATLHLVKADLWISDRTGIAVQQQFYYAGGNYDLATYSNMRIDANIPESAVKLKLPANVKREYPLK